MNSIKKNIENICIDCKNKCVGIRCRKCHHIHLKKDAELRKKTRITFFVYQKTKMNEEIIMEKQKRRNNKLITHKKNIDARMERQNRKLLELITDKENRNFRIERHLFPAEAIMEIEQKTKSLRLEIKRLKKEKQLAKTKEEKEQRRKKWDQWRACLAKKEEDKPIFLVQAKTYKPLWPKQ